MLKKINLFLLFILLFTGNLHSQFVERPNYKNGFSFNAESLLVLDIKFTYTRYINEKMYFETMLSFNFPYPFYVGVNNQFSFISLRDPYFYYGRAQIRAGFKHYLKPRFYGGEMLLYSFGYFSKQDVNYNDAGWTDNEEDGDFNVTRYKNDVELLVKIGWTFQKKNLLQDFYFGAGCRLKIFSYDVLGYDRSVDNSSNWFPFHKNTMYIIPTLHLGYQIGYCK